MRTIHLVGGPLDGQTREIADHAPITMSRDPDEWDRHAALLRGGYYRRSPVAAHRYVWCDDDVDYAR